VKALALRGPPRSRSSRAATNITWPHGSATRKAGSGLFPILPVFSGWRRRVASSNISGRSSYSSDTTCPSRGNGVGKISGDGFQGETTTQGAERQHALAQHCGSARIFLSRRPGDGWQPFHRQHPEHFHARPHHGFHGEWRSE